MSILWEFLRRPLTSDKPRIGVTHHTPRPRPGRLGCASQWNCSASVVSPRFTQQPTPVPSYMLYDCIQTYTYFICYILIVICSDRPRVFGNNTMKLSCLNLVVSRVTTLSICSDSDIDVLSGSIPIVYPRFAYVCIYIIMHYIIMHHHYHNLSH